MLGIAPEISSQQVLQAFHYDGPYLFLGAAFTTVGLLALPFPLVRRKFDLLLIFGIFAVLYGQRLWVQSEILRLTIHDSDFYPRLLSAIDFIVPFPGILFLDAAGFLDRMVDKIAAYSLLAGGLILACLTFFKGPSDTYHLINNVAVILALLALVTRFPSKRGSDKDFRIIRLGLFTFCNTGDLGQRRRSTFAASFQSGALGLRGLSGHAWLRGRAPKPGARSAAPGNSERT